MSTDKTEASDPAWHISRAGKSYGPLSDKEVRLLIESGKLKPDDLVWRPGFEGWISATYALRLSSPPPIPTKKETPRRRFGSWKLGIGAAIVMAAIAALYVASPYYALWRLKNAVVNKDSLVLERIVDWPGIREQIRSQIVATSMANTSTDKSAFGTLGTALGAAMVGPMIESMVHPATIIRATENNPNFAEKMKELDLRSGYFIGATAFRLDVEGPRKFGDDPTKLGLILEFQGTGWRVTHIDFPWQYFQEAMKEPTPSSERSSPVTDRKTDLAPSCKIENWKYHGLGDTHTTIEGTTSCASGTVRIQAYDDKGNYLGNATGYIQANSFTSMLSSPVPAKLEIKYQVIAD